MIAPRDVSTPTPAMPTHSSRRPRTLPHTLLVAMLSLGAVSALSTAAQAQSAQKYAFQLAVLSTSIGVGSGATSTQGIGVEPQLRFNRFYVTESFGISLGVGGQYTSHTAGNDELNIRGLFLEPRFVPVLGSSKIFPYLSGRLATLQQTSNFGTSSGGYAFGGGAGLVIKLSARFNLDAGAQLVRQQFSDFSFTDGSAGSFNPFTTYAAKIGFNYGFPR